MIINREHCFDMVLDDMEDKIAVGKILADKCGVGCIGLFLTRIGTEEVNHNKYTDEEVILMKMGVDISKVEGNFDKVMSDMLSDASISLYEFLHSEYDLTGYFTEIKLVNFSFGTDALMFLFKEELYEE